MQALGEGNVVEEFEYGINPEDTQESKMAAASKPQTVTFTASEIAHLKHTKGILHGIRSKQREMSIEEASNDGSSERSASGRNTPQDKIDPNEAKKHLEGLHGQSFDDDVFKAPESKQSDAWNNSTTVNQLNFAAIKFHVLAIFLVIIGVFSYINIFLVIIGVFSYINMFKCFRNAKFAKFYRTLNFVDLQYLEA